MDAQKKSPFQFGISSLLLLTAVVAVVLAVLRPLDLPPTFRFATAGYAIVILGYGVLRGAFLLRRTLQHQRQALAKREELEALVEQRRGQSKPPSGDSPTTNGKDADV
jgi:hypothetical protein